MRPDLIVKLITKSLYAVVVIEAYSYTGIQVGKDCEIYMSYSIQLFHPAVRRTVEEGQELDEFDHPLIDQSAVNKFVEKLAQYDYRLEFSTPQSREFVKLIGSCPIQVIVFDSEIAFSIPFWDNSEAAIFEALQDASELADPEHMVLFNPQEGKWIDA
jgi:hypothetical protein